MAHRPHRHVFCRTQVVCRRFSNTFHSNGCNSKTILPITLRERSIVVEKNKLSNDVLFFPDMWHRARVELSASNFGALRSTLCTFGYLGSVLDSFFENTEGGKQKEKKCQGKGENILQKLFLHLEKKFLINEFFSYWRIKANFTVFLLLTKE